MTPPARYLRRQAVGRSAGTRSAHDRTTPGSNSHPPRAARSSRPRRTAATTRTASCSRTTVRTGGALVVGRSLPSGGGDTPGFSGVHRSSDFDVKCTRNDSMCPCEVVWTDVVPEVTTSRCRNASGVPPCRRSIEPTEGPAGPHRLGEQKNPGRRQPNLGSELSRVVRLGWLLGTPSWTNSTLRHFREHVHFACTRRDDGTPARTFARSCIGSSGRGTQWADARDGTRQVGPGSGSRSSTSLLV